MLIPKYRPINNVFRGKMLIVKPGLAREPGRLSVHNAAATMS